MPNQPDDVLIEKGSFALSFFFSESSSSHNLQPLPSGVTRKNWSIEELRALFLVLLDVASVAGTESPDATDSNEDVKSEEKSSSILESLTY